MHGLLAHEHHLDAVLFEAKPFPGQADVAEALRRYLASDGDASECEAPEALQDPYSLRCAPHVLGVLGDALGWAQRWVEIEANGVSDNPLFHPVTGCPLMGGNFYGGHLAFAMDSLKAAAASVADLCDRQVALLVDARYSRGLPSSLTGGAAGTLQHGYKGLQITASALTAEALSATMPVSSFSRSTESHNQDKVSMGTIAARDALRVCELVERVVAITLMVGTQACDLRGTVAIRSRLARVAAAVRRLHPSLTEDRPLDDELSAVSDALASGSLDAVAG
jgi:histidine ammonia-lyase